MNMPGRFAIKPIDVALRRIVQPLVDNAWAGPFLVINGRLWDTRELPGLAALDASGAVAGYLLYDFHNDLCEIMVLESLQKNTGIGTACIAHVKGIAKERGIKTIAVTTTNDNIHAIRFYQKRGFVLHELRPNILELSRKLKPSIPLMGEDGIPLRDELEFRMTL